MTNTIDVTGLPKEVVEAIERYVDGQRRLARPTADAAEGERRRPRSRTRRQHDGPAGLSSSSSEGA